VNYQQSNILRVKLDVLLIASRDEPERLSDKMGALFKDELNKANAFWRKWAGIELYTNEIRVVRDDEDSLRLETRDELNSAVEKYYNGAPVVLIAESLPGAIDGTVGETAIEKSGFGVLRAAEAGTIAHEMGHVLIPRMFTHSLFGTHVGDAANLMAKGEARVAAELTLDDLFLTKAQAEAARTTIVKRRWSK
jgi:hypothetical protein